MAARTLATALFLATLLVGLVWAPAAEASCPVQPPLPPPPGPSDPQGYRIPPPRLLSAALTEVGPAEAYLRLNVSIDLNMWGGFDVTLGVPEGISSDGSRHVEVPGTAENWAHRDGRSAYADLSWNVTWVRGAAVAAVVQVEREGALTGGVTVYIRGSPPAASIARPRLPVGDSPESARANLLSTNDQHLVTIVYEFEAPMNSSREYEIAVWLPLDSAFGPCAAQFTVPLDGGHASLEIPVREGTPHYRLILMESTRFYGPDTSTRLSSHWLSCHQLDVSAGELGPEPLPDCDKRRPGFEPDLEMVAPAAPSNSTTESPQPSNDAPSPAWPGVAGTIAVAYVVQRRTR